MTGVTSGPAAPPFLVGERIYLRALVPSDADGRYPSWLNDEEVSRGNSHHVVPYTKEAASVYIRQSLDPGDALILAIVLLPDHRHIGNIALENIDHLARSAEFAILVGEKDAWGKGYALEAGRLLVRHGFDALGLHRISCGTFEHNEAMRRLALALGMREEGRRREAAFKAGSFVDVIEYGLLKDEFPGSSPTRS